MKKIICPVCGKKALEVREYTDGSMLYIHKIIRDKIIPVNNVTGCYDKNKKKNR